MVCTFTLTVPLPALASLVPRECSTSSSVPAPDSDPTAAFTATTLSSRWLSRMFRCRNANVSGFGSIARIRALGARMAAQTVKVPTWAPTSTIVRSAAQSTPGTS